MYQQCMRCDSKNLATLCGEKQVCLDCGWHSYNMSLIEAAREMHTPFFKILTTFQSVDYMVYFKISVY